MRYYRGTLQYSIGGRKGKVVSEAGIQVGFLIRSCGESSDQLCWQKHRMCAILVSVDRNALSHYRSLGYDLTCFKRSNALASQGG
jgi:hypothetical protein